MLTDNSYLFSSRTPSHWYSLRKAIFKDTLLNLDYASLEKSIQDQLNASLFVKEKGIYVTNRPVEITEKESFTVTINLPVHDELVIDIVKRAPAKKETVNFVVFDRPKEERKEPELILCRCDSLALFRQGCRCGGR